MKNKALCKYNTEGLDLCSITGNICSVYGCKKYENKYARKSCKHYRGGENGEEPYCKILIGKNGALPCETPRLNKNGFPVECTFYKRGDSECM